MRPTRVAVVGAGSWGTTMAALVCRQAPTVLWARRQELADEITQAHANDAYLPGVRLPAELVATASLADAVADAEVVAVAVPSHGVRAVLEQLAPGLRPRVPVISLTKGLEQGSGKRMTQVVDDVLPGHPVGVLTGPNLAREVMGGWPAASVLAMGDERLAAALQATFGTPTFRVYTNPDVVGSELAGALKNVVAIAAGMGDGLGYGDNTRAALVTRGLAELTRLGVALGGDPRTFSGLAGMGDLVATCTSRQSRNRYVGEQLGRGRRLSDVEGDTRMVAEGVRTSLVVVELAARLGVEVPIAEQVVAVCHHGRPAAEATAALMQRQARSELHGLRSPC